MQKTKQEIREMFEDITDQQIEELCYDETLGSKYSIRKAGREMDLALSEQEWLLEQDDISEFRQMEGGVLL